MFAKLGAAILAMTVALIGALPASAVGKSDVTFSSQSVPGINGTSFVYFQARGSGGAVSTVPTHRFIACPTPYYMRWTNVVMRPQGTTSYDVQIFDCNTGQPVNDGISRAGELSWQPGSHPILAGASSQLANGQVIYALNVSLSPPVVKPNQDTSLEASVADDFVAQADRTLNISVDPNGWSVASWSVDFGDGQTASLPGGATSLQVPHRYGAPDNIKPVVTAHVTGVAQVADFDPLAGNLFLLNEPFTVDVTNSTVGQITSTPIVAYTAPVLRAALIARIQPAAPPVSDRGLAAIEAPRGTPVYLYVRPIVDAEGEMTLDGAPAGRGHTVLLNWRLLSGSEDGPPGEVTAPGGGGPPDGAIVQQWNSPDRLGAGGPEPYPLEVDFTVRTTYPDGATRDHDFTGRVSVTVGYAASSG